jgi:ATP-binding protein involved in chromosome partitioning
MGGDRLADTLQTQVIARIPFAQPEESVHSSVYDEDSILGEIYSSLAEEIDYRLMGSSER